MAGSYVSIAMTGFRPKEDRNKLMCLRCFEFSDIGEKTGEAMQLCAVTYFQPTDARRMLCKECFKGKGHSTQGYLNPKVKLHGRDSRMVKQQ